MHSSTASGARTLAEPPPLASLLARGPVALFLDFDGTLVELAPGPDAIEPLPDLNDRLARLAHQLEGRCAVVSGRAIADIEKHLGQLPIAAAGSHGSDIRSADGKALGAGPQGLPEAIETRLRAFAADHELDYEHKPHGGALHYRRNPDHGAQAHAFAEMLADEHGWAAQGGKFVVELVASGANKGGAVDAFMAVAPFAGAYPLFIGDDLTDEAGFAACERMGGAGVLVGNRSETGAGFALADVAAVHQWLEF